MMAKLFRHGGSQAVRLPRQFRMPGKEVRITQTPHGVLLEPLDSVNEAKRQQFNALAGSCPKLEDVAVHSTPDLPRDELSTLIAAQAQRLGATLVTRNVREFRRVAGLPVENWHD